MVLSWILCKEVELGSLESFSRRKRESEGFIVTPRYNMAARASAPPVADSARNMFGRRQSGGNGVGTSQSGRFVTTSGNRDFRNGMHPYRSASNENPSITSRNMNRSQASSMLANDQSRHYMAVQTPTLGTSHVVPPGVDFITNMLRQNQSANGPTLPEGIPDASRNTGLIFENAASNSPGVNPDSAVGIQHAQSADIWHANMFFSDNIIHTEAGIFGNDQSSSRLAAQAPTVTTRPMAHPVGDFAGNMFGQIQSVNPGPAEGIQRAQSASVHHETSATDASVTADEGTSPVRAHGQIYFYLFEPATGALALIILEIN